MQGRLSINMLANMGSFVISILVSMWLVPFIIGSLGAEAYGFIPLTQQLINYMAVITVALNGMASRFFTYEIKSGNRESAERYFNTSFVSSAVLSVFIVIPLIIITVFIGRIINVPQDLLFDVRISLGIYGIMFILSVVGAPFSMAMFCENRLDISGILGSMNTLLRSLFIVLLLNLFAPKMWFVSVGSLIAGAVLFSQNIYYFRKLIPDISINIRKFDISRLKNLVLSGVWSSINYVGAILFLQIDLLVANWALGPLLAGEYSAVLQLSNLLRGFVATITVVFAPTMVELFAKDKMKELVEYTNKGVKTVGIIMALPVGLACGFGGSVLSLWLGESFGSYSSLFFLMTGHLAINLAVQPLFGIFAAANRVKMPAVVTLIMGTVNFILAILLAIVFKMGAFGIVTAGMIILTSKNLIFTPIYSAIITRQPWRSYYKGIFTPVASVGFIIILCLIFNCFMDVNNFAGLLIASAAITLIYSAMIYFVILNDSDRQGIKEIVFKKGYKSFFIGS